MRNDEGIEIELLPDGTWRKKEKPGTGCFGTIFGFLFITIMACCSSGDDVESYYKDKPKLNENVIHQEQIIKKDNFNQTQSQNNYSNSNDIKTNINTNTFIKDNQEKISKTTINKKDNQKVNKKIPESKSDFDSVSEYFD